MNAQKKILIIGSIFIVIISILFFSIRGEHKKSYDTTILEIDGIAKIAYVNNLDILLKNIRGISQLDNAQSDSLKTTLFISEKNLLESIGILKDKILDTQYQSLLKNKLTFSKEQMFNEYTKLLKYLEHKRFNIADKYYLFFESEKEIYFLITTAILNIPQAIENIAKIRGIGVGILNNNNKEENKFLLKNNVHSFLENIENIKFILTKLDTKDSTKLNALLDSIMTNFHNVNTMVDNLNKNSYTLTQEKYFLQTSQLVNNINNLFSVSINLLNDKLEQRKYELKNKLVIGIFFYFLLVSIAIFFMYINYKNKHKQDKERNKKKYENQFITILQDAYVKKQTLKEICDTSLNLIVDKFKAMDASLYLFDETNEKLYLGATYGIIPNSLKQTLELHENIISENILQKKINIQDINKTINLGNIQTFSTKLVTIPLIEFNISIGTLQLSFDEKFKNIDIEFLQQVISLTAIYINKALQDDVSKKYLNLINKNVLISQTDLDGNITHASEELCHLSGYTKEELLGFNHRMFRHEDMPDDFFIDLWDTIIKGTSWRGEIKDKAKDGTYYWVDTIISPDNDINGNTIGYTAIRTNISDRKKIEEIAITDALTLLYNRRHFDTMFTQQIEISRRSKKLLAFVLIDIDHFKQYNDTYGHQEGDTALKRVATALKRTLRRPDDYTFRLGGEEFGLLFYITYKDDAFKIAEMVRLNVEKLHIEHSGNSASPFVTISSGLSIINPNDINNADEIYKATDKALYVAKKSGRNQTSIV